MTALPRNGCHNRQPLVSTVIVQSGWTELDANLRDRTFSRYPVLREIPNPMSKDCLYSQTTVDARCDGCKWLAKETA